MKKGVIDLSSEQVMLIMHIILLILIIVAVLWYNSSFIKSDIKISNLESGLLASRLFYSDSCFAYSDIRVFPGIIDIAKFNNDRIKNCLNTENFMITANLDYNGKKLEVLNNNKFKEEFCKFEEKYFCKEEKQYVLVKEGDKLIGGVLNIRVMTNA